MDDIEQQYRKFIDLLDPELAPREREIKDARELFDSHPRIVSYLSDDNIRDVYHILYGKRLEAEHFSEAVGVLTFQPEHFLETIIEIKGERSRVRLEQIALGVRGRYERTQENLPTWGEMSLRINKAERKRKIREAGIAAIVFAAIGVGYYFWQDFLSPEETNSPPDAGYFDSED